MTVYKQVWSKIETRDDFAKLISQSDQVFLR